MISIIFPAYNERENVQELHRRIVAVMKKTAYSYEIIAVENGSLDGTLQKLKEFFPIKIIVLAKNLGQTAGLDAGIKAAAGDIVVTMDADLQNDPDDIPRLIQKLNEGYDVVSGWRSSRKDNAHRRVLSRLFKLLSLKNKSRYLSHSACRL